MRIFLFLIATLLTLGFANAASTPSSGGHAAGMATSWAGVYEGVSPCADCAGIKVELTLNKDKTYSLSEHYMTDKHDVDDTKVHGTFTFDTKENGLIILDKNANNRRFFIGKGFAEFRNLDGSKIKTSTGFNVKLKQVKSLLTLGFANAASTPSSGGHAAGMATSWAGVYEGVSPCADCAGIKVELTLNKDKTYSLSEHYMTDKHDVDDTKVHGTFTFDTKENGLIILDKNANNRRFFIGKGFAEFRNLDGSKIKTSTGFNVKLKQVKSFN